MAGIVQSTSTISVGNTNLAFTGNNTVGNFLIIAVSALTTGKTFTVSDTAGNVYKSLSAITDTPNSVESQIFFVPSCLAGANTVTFTPGAAVATVLAIHEFSGVSGIGLRANGIGTSPSISSAASSCSSGFSFGFISGTSTGVINTITPGTGWTQAEANVAAPTFLTEWRIDGGLLAATATVATAKGAVYSWTAELAALGHSQSQLESFGFTQWTGW